jgi:uncharacterized protein YndB with AHSA1/START domain
MSETPAGNASSASPGSPDRSPAAEGVPRLEPEPVLRMERTFSARRERVYAAWTESALLRRWSCPEDLVIGEAHNDLRVGGRFFVEMIEPESGERFVAVGRYLELDPPARIVMTHGWLHEGEEPEAVDARATRVTVELFDEGQRTRMVFVQRGFPNVASRDGHEEGWSSSFRKLDALLERPEENR